MAIVLQSAVLVSIIATIGVWSSSVGEAIPNLSEDCFRCLCHVTTKCDLSSGCDAGKCGPFNITRVYWEDAGRVTLPNDDPDTDHAWENCAKDYDCSKRIMEGYLRKFGKDCNGDGVTNCYDYMMVNGNGGYGCNAPLNRTAEGRLWLQRFEECQISLTSQNHIPQFNRPRNYIPRSNRPHN